MELETYTGEYITMTIDELQRATRQQIVAYLEARGTACYEHESTELLRQVAVEDILSESDGSV